MNKACILEDCRLHLDRNPHMTIRGDRLKEMREKKHYTQAEMGEMLGMTAQGYRNYENGEDPSTERLLQLCKILGCSADYLLGNVDQPAEHLADEKLPPDEIGLLILYRANKIPKYIRKMLGGIELLGSGDESGIE